MSNSYKHEKIIHITIIMISITIIVIGSLFNNYNSIFFSICISIGCSCLSASFIGYLLLRKKYIELRISKANILMDFYENLEQIVSELLWLENAKDNERFNWDLPIDSYRDLQFLLYAFDVAGEDKTITYEDAIDKLESMAEKYDLAALDNMTKDEKKRIVKMFNIVAQDSLSLVHSLLSLKENRILLDYLGYISNEEFETYRVNLLLAIRIMESDKKNYGAAVMIIKNSYQRIRNSCGYTNDLRVGVRNTIPFNSI